MLILHYSASLSACSHRFASPAPLRFARFALQQYGLVRSSFVLSTSLFFITAPHSSPCYALPSQALNYIGVEASVRAKRSGAPSPLMRHGTSLSRGVRLLRVWPVLRTIVRQAHYRISGAVRVAPERAPAILRLAQDGSHVIHFHFGLDVNDKPGADRARSQGLDPGRSG